MKVTTTYELLKIELGVLNEEKLNPLEKIRFLEIDYKSLLERNNTLA